MKKEIIIKGTIPGENQCICFSEAVKYVRVWLDKDLNLNHHFNKIVSHCYKILKDIGSILPVLTQNGAEMLFRDVISSKLDYCNSFNMSKANINKLQKVQNGAAPSVVRKQKQQLIRDLHW